MRKRNTNYTQSCIQNSRQLKKILSATIQITQQIFILYLYYNHIKVVSFVFLCKKRKNPNFTKKNNSKTLIKTMIRNRYFSPRKPKSITDNRYPLPQEEAGGSCLCTRRWLIEKRPRGIRLIAARLAYACLLCGLPSYLQPTLFKKSARSSGNKREFSPPTLRVFESRITETSFVRDWEFRWKLGWKL